MQLFSKRLGPATIVAFGLACGGAAIAADPAPALPSATQQGTGNVTNEGSAGNGGQAAPNAPTKTKLGPTKRTKTCANLPGNDQPDCVKKQSTSNIPSNK
jgi:hypothetical protein